MAKDELSCRMFPNLSPSHQKQVAESYVINCLPKTSASFPCHIFVNLNAALQRQVANKYVGDCLAQISSGNFPCYIFDDLNTALQEQVGVETCKPKTSTMVSNSVNVINPSPEPNEGSVELVSTNKAKSPSATPKRTKKVASANADFAWLWGGVAVLSTFAVGAFTYLKMAAIPGSSSNRNKGPVPSDKKGGSTEGNSDADESKLPFDLLGAGSMGRGRAGVDVFPAGNTADRTLHQAAEKALEMSFSTQGVSAAAQAAAVRGLHRVASVSGDGEGGGGTRPPTPEIAFRTDSSSGDGAGGSGEVREGNQRGEETEVATAASVTASGEGDGEVMVAPAISNDGDVDSGGNNGEGNSHAIEAAAVPGSDGEGGAGVGSQGGGASIVHDMGVMVREGGGGAATIAMHRFVPDMVAALDRGENPGTVEARMMAIRTAYESQLRSLKPGDTLSAGGVTIEMTVGADGKQTFRLVGADGGEGMDLTGEGVGEKSD